MQDGVFITAAPVIIGWGLQHEQFISYNLGADRTGIHNVPQNRPTTCTINKSNVCSQITFHLVHIILHLLHMDTSINFLRAGVSFLSHSISFKDKAAELLLSF